jgi:hypothetical protein
MTTFLTVLIFSYFNSCAFAAPPPLSENARNQMTGQPEVVKENIEDMKMRVLEKKTQSLVFKKLLKSESFESNLPIVTINHSNEMSSRYVLSSMVYTLDNEQIFRYSSEDRKNKSGVEKDLKIFKGPLAPGNHDLSVEIVYRGNDAGVFSYINDYKISSQTKKTFKIDKGQNLDVQIVSYEKGWILTKFKDRPDLKINFRSAESAKELR